MRDSRTRISSGAMPNHSRALVAAATIAETAMAAGSDVASAGRRRTSSIPARDREAFEHRRGLGDARRIGVAEVRLDQGEEILSKNIWVAEQLGDDA